MVELALLATATILILACGVFVAAEFSLIAVNRSTVERLSSQGDGQARGVLTALKSLSTQLSSAQVGITITNLVIGFLAQPAIADLIEQPLTSLGTPAGAVPSIATTIGLILATFLTMVFGELVPKNIAIARPLATAKIIQRPLLLFTSVMRWPIRLLNGSANAILRRVGIEPQEELASARSADELLSLVRRSAEKGTLAKETALMLERSINFSDLTAQDVMTPRVQLEALTADSSLQEALELARQTGLSRFPVYTDSLDKIVGIIHVKHIFRVATAKRATAKVKKLMHEPVLVPSTLELEPLLAALRKGGLQMAVVIDEYGGTAGLVTMEDLLEELVGEVQDEHDQDHDVVRQRKDGSWILSGLLRPDKIGEELGIYLQEEEEVETLGGLLLHHLERIPAVGDQYTMQAIDRKGVDLEARLTVKRMDGNRVDRVHMQTKQRQPDSTEEAS